MRPVRDLEVTPRRRRARAAAHEGGGAERAGERDEPAGHRQPTVIVFTTFLTDPMLSVTVSVTVFDPAVE